MAEKLEDGDFWLPAEFLGKGFFLEERRGASLIPEIVKRSGLVRENMSYSPSNMTMETESDEEDYVAGLTRQMAHSFLAEDNTSSFWDTRVLATSPQSTLCDAGIWSSSSTGSPNICSKASPRLSAFQERRNDDAMDILYMAAGELLRRKQAEQRASERYQLKKPFVSTKSSSIAGSHNNQIITRQQIQAAQFYKLKQQLLIKQQLSSAWSTQNGVAAAAAAATSNRPHGLGRSPWSQVQKPQPNPGMRAVFPNGPGARRESAGTGVFLPRRAGSPTARKPACSTVLLPARVVQALNLNLADAEAQPRIHETLSVHAKPVHGDQKRNFYQPPPASISGDEIRLPNEWTY